MVWLPVLFRYPSGGRPPGNVRVTQVSYPDGGQGTATYNTGSTTPWTINASGKITSTQTLTSTVTLDGLGRVSQLGSAFNEVIASALPAFLNDVTAAFNAADQAAANRAIQKAFDLANELLNIQQCGSFVTSVMLALPGVAQSTTIADYKTDFRKTNFVPTPANDPWVMKNGPGYTAHVDVIGASTTVHVDHPFRSNLAPTMIHEVFHTIYFGATDQGLAAAADITGARDMSMRQASNAFSKVMEQQCDPRLVKK